MAFPLDAEGLRANVAGVLGRSTVASAGVIPKPTNKMASVTVHVGTGPTRASMSAALPVETLPCLSLTTKVAVHPPKRSRSSLPVAVQASPQVRGQTYVRLSRVILA